MTEHTGARARGRAGCAGLGASLALLALLSWLQAGLLVAVERPQQPAAGPVDKPDKTDKAVDAGIRDALQAYQTALASLDADAVKKIQPSVDVEGLKRAFREMRSLEVDIDNIRLLSGDQTSARVSCRVAQTLTPKVGSRQATTVTRVLRLRRQDGAWVIQTFER